MSDDLHDVLSSEAAHWRASLGPNPSLADLLQTRKLKVKLPAVVATLIVIALASGLTTILLAQHHSGKMSQRTASCVPSVLSTQPGEGPYDPGTEPSLGRVARLQQVKLYGRDYFISCQDTINRDAPSADSPQPPRPMTSVTLALLSSGGYRRDLITVTVGEDGSFTAMPTIPRDAPLGNGTIVDEVGHRVAVIVVNG